MYRTAFALVILATLSGCTYVDGDGGDRSPRYGVRSDNDDWFRPRRGVVCNADNQVCYRNGEPNRRATRNTFGRGAVRNWW